MKVATWNVNSIRVREALVLDWLRRAEPDVLCLQETKVVDDDFPTEGFQRLGYAVAMAGQKTYNGVAIASRLPMEDVCIGFHDEPDPEQKRLIGATIAGVRIFSAYVPNGKLVGSPAFVEKLAWLRRLRETLERGPGPDAEVAICGDFNIAPADDDVHDPNAMRGQLHFHPDEHQALQELLELGLVDAFRLHHPSGKAFSWWDYRAGAFRRNLGLRIDFVFLTRPLAARCVAASMDVEPRREPKPSDHIPVIVELG